MAFLFCRMEILLSFAVDYDDYDDDIVIIVHHHHYLQFFSVVVVVWDDSDSGVEDVDKQS